MHRHDEARQELHQSIKCNQPYGHATESWKTWNVLYNLEQATGHLEAAAQTRQQAIQSFLAYRLDGGENRDLSRQRCARLVYAIHQKQTTELATELAQALRPEAEPWAKALIPKLQAILAGSRDPALADDPALDYDDAVELRLLLEELGSGS